MKEAQIVFTMTVASKSHDNWFLFGLQKSSKAILGKKFNLGICQLFTASFCPTNKQLSVLARYHASPVSTLAFDDWMWITLCSLHVSTFYMYRLCYMHYKVLPPLGLP